MKFTTLVLFIFSTALSACGQTPNNQKSNNEEPHSFEVQKTESEWKEQLSPLAYDVLRNQGTERAFSGKYDDFKNDGTYVCAGCGNPLFSSKTKFDSGTGWPSFYDVIGDDNVLDVTDRSHGWVRTEVVCGECGGHLGHVFNDGPKPTGLRYCINSVSLNFKPEE